MFAASTQIRIHYALTDQMGVVYHGHYAQFYEIGRAEWLRELEFSYKDIEAMGILMPVVELRSRFLRPARYEDLITVHTQLRELPLHHKIVFHHEIYNSEDHLLNSGEVTLYFMTAGNLKRTEMPAALREKLAPYFGC